MSEETNKVPFSVPVPTFVDNILEGVKQSLASQFELWQPEVGICLSSDGIWGDIKSNKLEEEGCHIERFEISWDSLAYVVIDNIGRDDIEPDDHVAMVASMRKAADKIEAAILNPPVKP